ncbi:MAG: flavin reductase [Bacilli bacterium]|nr:flavin reductase [Bacilli bacterium]
MRKDFGARPYTYPQPVFILAAFDLSGKANAMNAAWGGISEENEVSICLSANHKTVLDILATGLFSVSMGVASEVASCDYVGIVSGNAEPDKILKAGWHVSKGSYGAPIIDELPMTLECRLIEYDKSSCIMRGEILNVSADESVLTDGKIDPSKLRPICFDPCNNAYLVVGEKVGNAFKDGLALKK